MDLPLTVLKRAVDANHHALAAQHLRHFADQFGAFQSRRVDRHLVRAVVEAACGLFDRADATGHAEGNVEQAGNILHPRIVEGAAFGAGGDVVKHQLVSALIAIARGQFSGVAHIDVAFKAHAFDNAAVLDVEAGDDPTGGHQATALMASATVNLPS